MKSQSSTGAKKKVRELHIPGGFDNGPIKAKKLCQAYFPHESYKLHALMGFIGIYGSGKTHATVNLTLYFLKKECFTRIFIISPTYTSNTIFHTLKAKDDDIYLYRPTRFAAGPEQYLKKVCY